MTDKRQHIEACMFLCSTEDQILSQHLKDHASARVTAASESALTTECNLALFWCSDDYEMPAEQLKDLGWRFERALAAGGPGAHGGATDAAVRLSHLLKVMSCELCAESEMVLLYL